MKIVLLGDVGASGGYHAGDEAMAEAVAAELGRRGPTEVTAISGDLEDTLRRYEGWAAVPRIDFADPAWGDAERDERLAAVERAAGGDTNALVWDDPAWQVIQAVAAADAVVISGGGNLSSTWPEHVYERAALAALAARFNKRHVVTGQTVGPQLTERHGELVGAALTSAALVACREEPSAAIVRALGTVDERIVRTLDDAAFLEQSSVDLPEGPYVAATFSPHTGLADPEAYLAAAVDLLDAVATNHGYRIVLVPHQGEDGEHPTADLAIHQKIAAAAKVAQVETRPMLTAREIVALTQGAELVISSRYHPVVFALAGNVPALGIGVDAYTSTKIGGALENYAFDGFAFSVASLVDGSLSDVVDDVVARRGELRDLLQTANDVRRGESDRWWDSVRTVLGGGDVTPGLGLADLDRPTLGEWAVTSQALRRWSDAVSLQSGSVELSSEDRTPALEERVRELEVELADVASRLDDAYDEMDSLRTSAVAAYDLVSGPLQPLAETLENLPTMLSMQTELQAVYSTRTFRYLERPRRVYRRLRG